MFGWWREWRRKHRLKRPLLSEEQRWASQGAWQWSYVPAAKWKEGLDWIRTFQGEKNFEGCGGLKVTREMEWTIASQAALMLLAYPSWHFDNIQSVLVYPDSYRVQGTVRDLGGGIALQGESLREGEAWYGGPVILNWNQIEEARSSGNEGHSLTIHEFSHQLDMWNSRNADGVPPLPHSVDSSRWQARFQDEFDLARSYASSGHRILMNDYGMTSLAEFFAVSSEYYFQIPHELGEYHPGVFELLRDVYQIDWREWLPRQD